MIFRCTLPVIHAGPHRYEWTDREFPRIAYCGVIEGEPLHHVSCPICEPFVCRHECLTEGACRNIATWRGSPDSDEAFTQAWRARDLHRMPTDIPIEQQEGSQTV